MKDIILGFIKKHKVKVARSLIIVFYFIALFAVFVTLLNINVVQITKDKIYDIDEIEFISEKYDCILILGAGVKADGSPSPMLFDRLQTANSVFQTGKYNLILVSGDSEHEGYSETTTMKNELINMGIEEDIILSDGYGLSTYESIWRAKYVYGFDKVIIISQKYHLNRALYIAEKLQIDAIGVDGALRSYGKQPLYSFREYLARVKDVFYVEMGKASTYTDRWEDLKIE